VVEAELDRDRHRGAKRGDLSQRSTPRGEGDPEGEQERERLDRCMKAPEAGLAPDAER
jgi:hypothetical protein